MSECAVRLTGLGKMYRLYARPGDKLLDALGVGGLLFWRRHSYQEFWALRHLDLEVHRGERLGIIGRNGAGKSTLLKVISGNLAATEGRCEVHGRVQALLEMGTGFHPEFTGRENIRAALAFQGLSAREAREKEEEVIDFAELDEFMEQPLKTYSSGMYARLAFSTATAIAPDLLIIDEILGAGDAYFSGKCVERMRRLTEGSGATVLFVSHDLGSVQQLCQRVVWLDRGVVREMGEPLPVIKAYSAEVRREEELRLRARDQKVLKKQAVLVESPDDLFRRILFHVVPAAGAWPSGEGRFYALALTAPAGELGRITLGSPMDNAESYAHHVLDAPGYQNWGRSEKDATGTYRACGDFGGRYYHAPFVFSVPKAEEARQGELTVAARYRSPFPLILEGYNGKEYALLGTLPARAEPGWEKVTFECRRLAEPGAGASPPGAEPLQAGVAVAPAEPAAPAGETPAAPGQPAPAGAGASAAPGQLAPVTAEPHSLYGSQELRITAVRLFDASGKEGRAFEPGGELRVEIKYATEEELPCAVFFFCVYAPDGKCALQVGTNESDWPARKGKGSVVLGFAPCLLGAGQYVASVGAFKHSSPAGLEAPAYCVLDRCIHFEVLRGAGYERGMVLQPYTAVFQPGSKAIHG